MHVFIIGFVTQLCRDISPGLSTVNVESFNDRFFLSRGLFEKVMDVSDSQDWSEVSRGFQRIHKCVALIEETGTFNNQGLVFKCQDLIDLTHILIDSVDELTRIYEDLF
jgi:hypothetical protein